MTDKQNIDKLEKLAEAATPERWVNAPHRCAKDDEVAELRACLRLAWASSCGVPLSTADIARIRKAGWGKA